MIRATTRLGRVALKATPLRAPARAGLLCSVAATLMTTRAFAAVVDPKDHFDVSIVSGVELQQVGKGKPTIRADTLWAEQPVVITLIRRFGCPLCRMWSSELMAAKDELAELGVSAVAIGHQFTGAQDFIDSGYWNGPVLIDKDATMYKAMELKRMGFWDGYGLLNRNVHAKYAEAREKKISGNLTTGDGLQLGGTFVVMPGGKVVFEHHQENYGDDPKTEDILAAIRKAKAEMSMGPVSTGNAAKEAVSGGGGGGAEL